jgi:hypothetical protein
MIEKNIYIIAEAWRGETPQDKVKIARDYLAMAKSPASRQQHNGNPRHLLTKEFPAWRLRDEKVLPRRRGVASSSAILGHARVV